MGRNKEKSRLYHKKWYEDNKEKMRKYREINKEKINIQRKKYREDNKEKMRKYRENNKEHIKEYNKKYREINKEKINIHARKYNKDNKDRISIQRKKYYEDNKLQCLLHYSDNDFPSCNCCGITNMDVLSIDHINGGGNLHRKKTKNRRIYLWLRSNNYPDGYQVLCYTCNMGKHVNNECPHRWSKDYINRKTLNTHYKYLRIPILEKFSNGIIQCKFCTENNIFCLAIDHVNGNGAKHRKEFDNYLNYITWLRDSAPLEDFQVLCHNCNILKHITGGLNHENSNPTANFTQKSTPNTCIEVENH